MPVHSATSRSILILSRIYAYGTFLHVFPRNPTCIYMLPICVKYPTNLILLHLINRIILVSSTNLAALHYAVF